MVTRLVVTAVVGSMLTACASGVGWGKRYEVIHSNKSSITVKYDSTLADWTDFSAVVDSHCRQYGKDAVPAGPESTQGLPSAFGGVQTVTFLCQ